MDNKKMTAVLLSIFLAAGTLEGCGSGQAAGENTAETSSESSGRGGMMAVSCTHLQTHEENADIRSSSAGSPAFSLPGVCTKGICREGIKGQISPGGGAGSQDDKGDNRSDRYLYLWR